VLRKILISFIHITDTRLNNKEKVGKIVTRNTEFADAVKTLVLRPTQ